MIAVDRCFRTMQYSMQLTEQIPNNPPRMGAKSTTTSNHPSTPVGVPNVAKANAENIIKALTNTLDVAVVCSIKTIE